MVKIRIPYISQTRIAVSSSILNWKDKLLKRLNAKEYHWWRDRNRSVLFFGFYRPSDWLKFFWHRGEKTIIWCGADIIGTGRILFELMKRVKATHICENEIEKMVLQIMLRNNGHSNEILMQPLFFSNPNEFPITYRQSKIPEVFTHINRNAERESGFFTIERMAERLPQIKFHIYGKMAKRNTHDNIYFHGLVPEEQFNREIRQYHGSLRLHEFDGASEIMTKSVLMGQYPISKIRYPFIDSYKDEDELVELLDDLKNKKEPNYKARNYYLKQFKNPIWNVSFASKNHDWLKKILAELHI